MPTRSIILASRSALILELTLGSLTLAASADGSLRHFGTEDGLPSLFIVTVFQDRSETMWAGGFGALARNDGLVWRNEPLPVGMSDARISDLTEDRRDRLWVASNQGVAVRDGSAWTRFTVTPGELPSNFANAIACDSAGMVWVATDEGVARFDGKTWRTFTPADGLGAGPINDIIVTRAGDVWVSSEQWIARYAESGWNRIDESNGLPELGVTALGTDEAGMVWIGIPNGVSAYDGSKWQTYGREDGIYFDFVTAITGSRDGGIWIGYEGGVNYFRNRQSNRLSLGAGGTEASSIAEDRNDGVWVALEGEGLYRWDRSERENLRPPPEVSSFGWVAADSSGGVWIAGGADVVARYHGGSWTQAVQGVVTGIWGMLVDAAGAVWLGSQGTGVGRYDGTSWTTFTVVDGLSSNPGKYPLIATRDSSVWFGMSVVDRWDGSSWRTYTVAEGLAGGFLNDAHEARNGDLWLTSSEGVSRFDGSIWHPFSQADGLPSRAASNIVEDARGVIWVGTEQGAAWFDGSRWQPVTDGLPDPFILKIVQDSRGDLWFDTRLGVARYRDGSWRVYGLNDGLPGDARILQADRNGGVWLTDGLAVFRITDLGVRRFNSGEGLDRIVSLDNFSEFYDAFCQDRNDAFWFFADGMEEIHVGRYRLDLVAPQTVLLSRPGPVLGARVAEITATAAWGDQGTLQYRSRIGIYDPMLPDLGGQWSEWTQWSAVPVWTYHDLSDITYIVETHARDVDGNIDPTPARVVFEVDATAPAPVLRLSSIVAGDSVVIEGTADDQNGRFRSYRLEILPIEGPPCSPGALVLYGSDSVSVRAGPIAYWRTTACADGAYDLMLSVTDTLGLMGTSLQRVVVDNQAPFSSQTSGAAILPETGGHIYTTGREAHLYFPPHSVNGRVLITKAPADPDSVPLELEDGAQRIIPGFDVTWPGGVALKDVTFDMCYSEICYPGASAPPSGMRLALYRIEESGRAIRIGGTVDRAHTRIVTTIREPGRYALFADRTTQLAGSTLTALTLIPRVFSPAGGYGNHEVAIAFSLGHDAPVTVKVYNRAGRLVRDVVSGATLGAGANVVRWDGRNRDGAIVVDGLFIVSVEAGSEEMKMPLVVVR